MECGEVDGWFRWIRQDWNGFSTGRSRNKTGRESYEGSKGRFAYGDRRLKYYGKVGFWDLSGIRSGKPIQIASQSKEKRKKSGNQRVSEWKEKAEAQARRVAGRPWLLTKPFLAAKKRPHSLFIFAFLSSGHGRIE